MKKLAIITTVLFTLSFAAASGAAESATTTVADDDYEVIKQKICRLVRLCV